ncbi:MAG: class II aldolase/adducin family protein [Acidobacteria bacterium]|nr:class II aldolase/adducin family protein [Acidobacteriota bacterium]
MKKTLLAEIVFYSKLLHKNGLVSGTDGNISARTIRGFWATPTGFPKRELKENQIIELDPKGNPLSGVPSSEIKMHLEIYNARKDVNAIVHAHPPFATALSLIDENFEKIPLSEFFITLQKVEVIGYKEPGSIQLAKEAANRFLSPYTRAVILKNHGAVTIGNSLKSAYYRMESLEHSSKIFFLAKLLGNPKTFDKKLVARLIELGNNYGLK